MMTFKQYQRLWHLGLMLLALGGVVIFILTSLQDNLLYFMTPTQLLSKPVRSKKVRLGGVVVKESVIKNPQTLEVSFVVSDGQSTVSVVYRGILPDLFREGQGVIAEGAWQETHIFRATSLLAKHDENYQPPQLTAAL